jgi:hypothetical protein
MVAARIHLLPKLIMVKRGQMAQERTRLSMWGQYYEGESNENRKNFFKFNLLNKSGTQLHHFST